ncbi:UNVERIFIED_CONTAM: hypothetical protein Sradi_0148900 [Sesamum radiatum]|uniref:Retrovirus-related Pol polyprotein from transposon TNT 1-94-like beta-barrel domain-containing protein n=1 Tax=Sesamum radiatum TaxID=300843 RepID=A0AAW2WL37_SESRA
MNASKQEILFYSNDNLVSQNMWYLDSGCSNHMTGNRDIFEKLDPNVSSQIILSDGSQRSAKGKGTIAIHTKEGNKKLITDVLSVPNLWHNLLCGQLIQKDYPVYFDDGRCRIFDKKKNVVTVNVEMRNKNFH